MKLLFLSALPLVLLTLSCSEKADTNTEKANVKEIVQKLYKAFESEDMDLMSTIMAHDEDMVNFGTDITEHEVGWKEWEKSHLAQFEAIDKAKLTSKELTVFISKSADAAWFSDITDWNLVIQKDSLNINNVRITGVLEKRDDVWKIVQVHASVPQGQAE